MRPAFHFTARDGWINDPHAFTYTDGKYHAFFQYVPGRTSWDLGCHWGHATGPDLLSLVELEPALFPGDGDDGVWTGCLVPGRAFYTSVAEPGLAIGRIRVATPDDGDLIRWTKGEVVVTAPPGVGVAHFRDPHVVESQDGWLMTVGAGLADGTAAVLVYRSHDLSEWTYDGILLSRSAAEIDPWLGALWECPQLVAVGDRHALVFSIWADSVLYGVGYAVGDLGADGFAASGWGILSYGPSPYAPTTYLDADGRPCLTFWLRDVAGAEESVESWAGAHSIPYLLGLRGDALTLTPHPDLDRYAQSDAQVAGAAEVHWDGAGTVRIRSSTGAAVAQLAGEGTDIVIGIDGAEWRMPRHGAVRVIVDGPVLEVSSAAGMFAAPVPTFERLVISGAGEVRALAR